MNGPGAADDAHVMAVVLCWNDGAAAQRCAESVLGSAGVHASVLIVDNASTDDSAQRLTAALGEQRMLRLSENRGYAGGMNAGLAEARRRDPAALMVLLTQDVILEPDALAHLCAALHQSPRAGIAAPVVARGGAQALFSAGGVLRMRTATTAHLSTVTADQPYDVEWADGCCLMLDPDMLDEVGVLDERYFMYFEENDLCQRARRAGWRVLVVPAARATQDRTELPGLHYFYYMSRNRFLYWSSNWGTGSLRVATGLGTEVLHSVRMLLGSVVHGSRSETALRWRWLVRQVRGALIGAADFRRGRFGYREFT